MTLWTDNGTLDDVARKLCNEHHEFDCWDALDDNPSFSGPQQSSKAYWRRISEPLADEFDRLRSVIRAHKDACGLVDGGGWDVDMRLWEAAGLER